VSKPLTLGITLIPEYSIQSKVISRLPR